MTYVDAKEKQARDMVGKRVEIPVHYDMWMRGARFGRVVGLSWEYGSGQKVIRAIRVKMEHPQVKRLVKIARIDFDYVTIR